MSFNDAIVFLTEHDCFYQGMCVVDLNVEFIVDSGCTACLPDQNTVEACFSGTINLIMMEVRIVLTNFVCVPEVRRKLFSLRKLTSTKDYPVGYGRAL